MLGEDVTSVVGEFLVVFVHAVAYACAVYPESSFSLVRQYGVATYENNHPGVRIWAENAVKAVMKLIYANVESRLPAVISIVVLEDSVPKERFGIVLRKYVIPEQESQPRVQPQSDGEIRAVDVIDHFRACLLKLHSTVGPQKPRPATSNRTMTVMFEGDPQLNDLPVSWITAEAQGPQSRGRIEPIREIELQSEDSVFAMNVFRQKGLN